MKFSVVALFAAGAMASVIPDYVEEPVYAETPAVSEAPEVTASEVAPEEPEVTEPAYPEMTTSTITSTIIHTVTDCADTVTDCPADATKVVEEVITITTVCEVDEPTAVPTSAEEESPEATESGDVEYPEEIPTSVEEESPEVTESPEEPEVCVPATKVKTITTSYTTVIPTTIVETYVEDCPEPTEGAETPVAPVPSGGFGNNGTIPGQPDEEEPVTAGAAGLVGSVFTAAFAGLAAYAFA